MLSIDGFGSNSANARPEAIRAALRDFDQMDEERTALSEQHTALSEQHKARKKLLGVRPQFLVVLVSRERGRCRMG
jgi:hypothetical protein